MLKNKFTRKLYRCAKTILSNNGDCNNMWGGVRGVEDPQVFQHSFLDQLISGPKSITIA